MPFLFHFSFPRGNQEVIQREIKDFFDNNRFTEKEIVKETELTIFDASRFFSDFWHTKEEKREIFFRWYLQKKLCGKGIKDFCVIVDEQDFTSLMV